MEATTAPGFKRWAPGGRPEHGRELPGAQRCSAEHLLDLAPRARRDAKIAPMMAACWDFPPTGGDDKCTGVGDARKCTLRALSTNTYATDARLGPGQGSLLFDSADDRPHDLISRGSLGFVIAARVRRLNHRIR